MEYNLIFFLLFGFVLTVLFTPLCIVLARKFNLMDDPKKHKHPAIIHTKPIPRAGGLPIYLTLLVALLIFFPLTKTFLAILIAGFFVVALGLLDDKFDINPYLRFTINILCAAVVVFEGLTLPFITNPLGGILHFTQFSFFGIITLSHLIAIFWIVWVMNMLNWSKGVDGQMPGVAAIAALVIGVASLRFPHLGQTNILASQMSFLVAGSAVGFLLFNYYPARIFPGYSSTILGFIIGVLSILSSVKLATALLVLGVPATDFIFTFTRRILSKKSPFWHDKQHLHHLLLKKGWGQRRVAFFYWGMSALLGLIALNLSSKGKVFAIILLIVLVGGFILTLRFLTRQTDGYD